MLARRAIIKLNEKGIRGLFSAIDYRLSKRVHHRYLKSGAPLGRQMCRVHALFHPNFNFKNQFQLHWIEPKEIKYISGLKPRRFYGKVEEGDWDLNCKLFDNHPAYIGLKEYVETGSTDRYYDHFQSAVSADGFRSWGHESVESFDQRMSEIDSLIDSLRTKGYQPQQNLADSENNVKNNELIPVFLNEITVDIGRNGQPLWNGYGSHRLSLAKLLNINEIVVIVATRHVQAPSEQI